MTKERYQNPSCGDTINLRLFTYTSNNRSDIQSIQNVEIYFRDPATGESTLVETHAGDTVVKEDTGEYLLTISADSPTYKIGHYHDKWSVIFQDGECAAATVTNDFQIYSHLWFTTAIPPIYDFNFDFRPNKIRKGSKRYLIIQITPNVAKGADILPYYENLAIVSDIRISIEQMCGDCVPAEQDLRLVVDRVLVDSREKGYAYYYLDTNELDEGIYNIWFEMCFGENVFISDKMALQIFS